MDVYAIKVTLLGTRPPVWRRFLVKRDVRLDQLHRTLQTVMGWTNFHLHQFVFQKQKQSDRTKQADLIAAPGMTLLYEYDFGDGWQHELRLEEILIGDASFQQFCVAGSRACPPEDCGGPHGYAELLEAVRDATNPEHDSAREWLGEHFDPEHFAVVEINQKLRRRKSSVQHASRRPSNRQRDMHPQRFTDAVCARRPGDSASFPACDQCPRERRHVRSSGQIPS
jgi:pRiA4b ORF-3-like protein